MSQSDRGAGAVSLGQSPTVTKRSARGESKNNPVNCFSRGDALQVRASLNGRRSAAPTKNVCVSGNINYESKKDSIESFFLISPELQPFIR